LGKSTLAQDSKEVEVEIENSTLRGGTKNDLITELNPSPLYVLYFGVLRSLSVLEVFLPCHLCFPEKLNNSHCFIIFML
jgi:hypothetical protein